MAVARFLGWAAVVTIVLGVAAPVPAARITHTTPPRTSEDGKAADVSPPFTSGTRSLVAVVSNLQAQPDGVIPLCVICPPAVAEVSRPTVNLAHPIIGDAADSGFYTRANGSVTRNGRDLFLLGPITFNLTIAGLSEASTMTGPAFALAASPAASTDTGPQRCVTCDSAPSSVLVVVLVIFVAVGVLVQWRWRDARGDAALAAPALRRRGPP